METRPEFALPGRPVAEFAPVVDLSDGRLLGMEAGVSWEHPEHGAIPGHRLVPWAQKNGEIVPIGAWLAATACLEALRWTPSVQLAVRVTLPQLARGQGSLAIRRALEESGLPADRVTVEVPESAVTDDGALADLVVLASLEVELAVFEVGAALSSFEPLSLLGVGAVKIDGELTRGLGVPGGMGHLVVEAVIDMAHAQGLSVLVEGMATADEVEAAARLGAEAGQGPFFSPLLAADDAAALGGAAELPRFSLVTVSGVAPTMAPAVEGVDEDAAGAAESGTDSGTDPEGEDEDAGEATAKAAATRPSRQPSSRPAGGKSQAKKTASKAATKRPRSGGPPGSGAGPGGDGS